MYKIWKTLLLCLLCAVLLLSCAACGDSSERSSSKKKRSDKDSDIFDSGYDPNYIVPGGKQLPDDVRISSAYPFSEGLAIVKLADYSTTYCINKKGEIVFQLDEPYIPYTDFLNGRIVLYDYDNEKYFVCDTSGNLTSLDNIGATLGATRIEIDRGELLDNGYFFLVKTQTDYTGSSDQVALANFDGEIVIDYNDNLDSYNDSAYDYYNGFLCNYDYCWNLSDGSRYDSSAFYDIAPIKYQSDLWSLSYDDNYRDERTGETVLDLDEYDEIELGEFQNGYAPAYFCVSESGGQKHYFTVLKENGDFCYEPIQIPEVKDANGKVITPGDGLLSDIERDENSFALLFSSDMIAVFDTKGLVSTAPFDLKGGLIYRDGVLLDDVFPQPFYYDLDGELLFPQKID